MPEDTGLLHAFVLDGTGQGKRVGWEEVRSWTPSDGTLWLHLDYQNETVDHWLQSSSGLDDITLQGLLASETRPRAIFNGDRLLVILRGINCNPGADPDDMVALRMILEPDRILSVRHRRVMAVQDVVDGIAKGEGPKNTGDFLTFVCGGMTDRMAEVVTEIDDKTDEMEEAVLEKESYELRSELSKIRRQAIALRRYIAPQRDILLRLQSERISVISDVQRLHIREEAERTARLVEDMDSARDRAAVTQEELNNRISEQMNKAMFVLSIVAAIFLPLGLLTGLLGINVGGIPGAESKWGFVIVSSLLAVVGVALLGVFKRLKWL